MVRKVISHLAGAVVLSLMVLLSFQARGQYFTQPVSWRGSVEKADENLYDLTFVATMGPEWHIYDMEKYEGGPNPTTLELKLPEGVKAVGMPYIKSKVVKSYDNAFKMEVGVCSSPVVIVQRVEASSGGEVISTIEWQACKDGQCLTPEEKTIRLVLPGPAAGKTQGESVVASASDEVSVTSADTAAENEEEGISLWSVILEAVAWGFVALLTPCVFPMVPMTVSFFLKNSGSKRRGRFMAMLYGISIVALYTLPIGIIILITYFVGGDAVTADIFNWLATHWIPNLIFFAIFMVFAASFFGAFEITMPSRFVNKADSKSDKGGLIGVFFMALTLVLVSFSCTGPIVGSVLIKSTQGEIWEPVITMLAFSVAFALPFTVFAFAPSLLKDLPKSGGWLNSVKVVLGFLELALGLKFLSVADQTYHWGILDREVYLALWIVIFTLLGFYLLGKIRFVNDTPREHLSVKRLLLSVVVFAFVVYMIPGMWGAPLKALSGYLPPLTSQDFVILPGGRAVSDGETGAGEAASGDKAPKYSDFLDLPHNLEGFFDYNEALEYARRVNKPLFVDFTGHGCVNCREMEAVVWSDSRVLELLRNEYVIVALYADDKKRLPESEWVTLENGKVLKELGKINSNFVMHKFGANAQPYYILLDGKEKPLASPRGYNTDIDQFVSFLKEGVENYRSSL